MSGIPDSLPLNSRSVSLSTENVFLFFFLDIVLATFSSTSQVVIRRFGGFLCGSYCRRCCFGSNDIIDAVLLP